MKLFTLLQFIGFNLEDKFEQKMPVENVVKFVKLIFFLSAFLSLLIHILRYCFIIFTLFYVGNYVSVILISVWRAHVKVIITVV